jgi:hypothetical protein
MPSVARSAISKAAEDGNVSALSRAHVEGCLPSSTALSGYRQTCRAEQVGKGGAGQTGVSLSLAQKLLYTPSDDTLRMGRIPLIVKSSAMDLYVSVDWW